jgi:hypothetical protein
MQEPQISFEKALEQLINCHSIENESNTPDFILAEYIRGCLDTFRNTVNKRDKWYGIRATGTSIQHITQPCCLDMSGPDPNDQFRPKCIDGDGLCSPDRDKDCSGCGG